MPEYISSDTNVWIDFANVDAVEVAFKLDCIFLMYEKTLSNEVLRPIGLANKLIDNGICCIEISAEEFFLALDYATPYPPLSEHDRIALAVAKTRGITLMTGDNNLRKAASKEGVDVIGTIGILDRAFLEERRITAEQYVSLLVLLRDHPKTRLPKSELDKRIRKYSEKN